MSHQKVRRGALPFQRWMEILIKQLDHIIVNEFIKLPNWTVIHGKYTPEEYLEQTDEVEISEGEWWVGPDITAIFRELGLKSCKGACQSMSST
jgi:hypothetical protein